MSMKKMKIQQLEGLNGPDEIIENLFLGSHVSAKNGPMIQKLKITHVLNCTPNDKDKGIENYFEKDGISYKRLEMLDETQYDLMKDIDKGHKFIHDTLGSNGRILVHCHMGASRSASVVISYLMTYKVNEKTKKLFTLKEAFDWCYSKRNAVDPNMGFMMQLMKYEKKKDKSIKGPSIDYFKYCVRHICKLPVVGATEEVVGKYLKRVYKEGEVPNKNDVNRIANLILDQEFS